MNTLERLDELLESHNLTLYNLAKMSGVSYSTLTSTKSRGGQLSLDTIERICGALGLRPYEFFMTQEDRANLRYGHKGDKSGDTARRGNGFSAYAPKERPRCKETTIPKSM